MDEVLAAQRAGLRRTLDELAGTVRITARVQAGQLRRREVIVARLRRAFLQQQAARERYLWPAVRRRVADGDRLARDANRRRGEIEELLILLRWHDERSPAQNEIGDRLIGRMAEHLDLEAGLLETLAVTLSLGQSERLGEAVSRASRFGPIRPHPAVPRPPWLIAALARPLGWLDRLTEAVEGSPYAD
ncbi:MAG TPA: hypothetical protein VG298_05460 [Acidimicrobiales bacterium]|nr:hypothetical protein [Acidimicrobiales bacterium]